MRLFQAAGLPDGVINLVYGSGADDRRRRAREPRPRRHPLHRLDRRLQRHVEDGRRRTSARYRNYPRIVGETGGKDFIVAHPSADLDALATAIVRGAFEYQGQKCSAASRVYAPVEPLAGAARAARRGGRDDQGRRRRRLRELHGRRDRRQLVRDPARRDRGGARARRAPRSSSAAATTTRRGYFVEPTVIETRDPSFRLLRDELFGPVVTTYVYDEQRLGRDARPRRRGSPYGLTGAVFAEDRAAVARGHASGCATPPATSTSTTSRPAPSSASSRSAARAPRARTTRRARCGT